MSEQVVDADYGGKDSPKHRSGIACIRCRKRHIKCDGVGPPCTKCRDACAQCEYTEAEKKVMISMKYLSQLHEEIQRLKKENTSLRSKVGEKKPSQVLPGGDQQPGGLGLGPKRALDPFDLSEEGFSASFDDAPALERSTSGSGEIIPQFLDKNGQLIHSRTGDRMYVGASSMTLFGLEINKLVEDADKRSPDDADGSSAPAAAVLEREGNAYRIMVGETHTRPGIDVNFTLPSYSYAMLLVDTFISYNDGVFYFFNEGLIKEGLRRLYNEKPGHPFHPDYGNSMASRMTPSAEGQTTLETVWFCKVLLIFAIGEMYLGTANNLDGYKQSDSGRKRRKKEESSSSARLPGSGFFNQASDLFKGLFAGGAINNCAREGGIEVLLLYAFYLQVADCTVASYFYFGLALRSSLILGIHVDAGNNVRDRYEVEHRRRLWWTVYIYERMLASKAGLPLSLVDDDISTPLPADFDMSNPPEDCKNYVFPEAEYIRSCIKIIQINTRILRKLYTRHPSQNILPTVHGLVVSLLRWKKNLPDYVDCNYATAPGEPLKISRLVVNLMTEFLQGVNLAVRPLLFHFVMVNLKTNNGSDFVDLSKYSSLVLRLLNASFQASINTIRSLWALMPDNMVALFGYMDREYLFTATVTLILFNSTFGVHEATLEHLDHALIIFTKMRNLGNHPATLRRAQILRLLTILDFHGAMRGLLRKHSDHVAAPDATLNSAAAGGFTFVRRPQNALNEDHSEATATAATATATPAQGLTPNFGISSPSALQTPVFSITSPSFSQAEIDVLGSMAPESSQDEQLWNDITSQAAWLGSEAGEEFNVLATRNAGLQG